MRGDRETGAMERYYSEEPKLIDFFKLDTPLRKDYGGVREQSYVNHPRNLQLGCEGNGDLPAIADSGLGGLKLEPPSGVLMDFLGAGNGDDRNHQLAVSRSSSDEGKHPMLPKWIQEAITGEQWSVITERPSLPNLDLKLLSPSPTGTQASGTSPPKTPTFDMELNSRAQPCITTIPEGESTFSAGSSRLVEDSHPDVANRNHQYDGEAANSRVYKRSQNNAPKRLRIRIKSQGADINAAKLESRKGDGSVKRRKLCAKDEEEQPEEAVVQAAASLLSLSSNDDDWRRTSSTDSLVHRQKASSLMPIEEGAERESGEEGSIGGYSSSVLSRPSNKRRYRLVAQVLAESPRVR